MTLKEFVNKLDANIVVYVIKSGCSRPLFKREYASDAIPDYLSEAEVNAIYFDVNQMQIFVKSRFNKCSFRDLISRLNAGARIDVWVINCDGTKEKVYSDFAVYCVGKKYDDYLVKQVNTHKSKWKYAVIDIVIEPCGDMEET